MGFSVVTKSVLALWTGLFVAIVAIASAAGYFIGHERANSAPRLLGGILAKECNKTTLAERTACLIDISARLLTRQTKERFAKAEFPGPMPDEKKIHDYFVISETVNSVQWLTNTSRYSWRSESPQFKNIEPGMDAEKALYEGIGFCGAQVETAMAVLKVLGYETRRVQFYGKAADLGLRASPTWQTDRYSHIGLEIKVADHWSYIDPSFGFFLTDPSDRFSIQSLSNIRAHRGKMVANNMDPWTQFSMLSLDVRNYLSDTNASVVIGGTGLVSVPLVEEGNRKKTTFFGTPNYVGDNERDGRHSSLKLRFDAGPQPYRLVLEVSRKVCDNGFVTVNGVKLKSMDEGVMTAEVIGTATVAVESQVDLCYWTFKSAALVPAE